MFIVGSGMPFPCYALPCYVLPACLSCVPAPPLLAHRVHYYCSHHFVGGKDAPTEIKVKGPSMERETAYARNLRMTHEARMSKMNPIQIALYQMKNPSAKPPEDPEAPMRRPIPVSLSARSSKKARVLKRCYRCSVTLRTVRQRSFTYFVP